MKLIFIVLVYVTTATFSNFVESKNNPNENVAKELHIRQIRSPDKETSLFSHILERKRDSLIAEQSAANMKREDKLILGEKKDTKLGFLPLPPGYNKLTIPLANISKELFIQVYLSIREILDVDDRNGFVEMDAELGISWIDWEVWKYFIEDKEAKAKAQDGPEEITLDSEFLTQIWKPDIFIEEMASVDKTSILSELINLRFLVKNEVIPGAISFQSRQSFKIRCDMDFHFYPADIQTCPIHIRSYSYSQEQLFLMWNPRQKVFLDSVSDPNFDFQVSDVEPGEKLYDLFTTSQASCCNHRNFSTITFNLQIRRNLMYHVVQTCLPSILLILITWLCFLLPPDMVEVRIGISMTTLLTMTAMFTGVRQSSPDVSYPMAIDYWMVFCMLLLFIALVLFTVIYWFRRRANRLKEEGGVDEITNIEKFKSYNHMVGLGRKYAFVLFACLFIIFLVVFTVWILTGSEHCVWEPNSDYNALPLKDENDNSNRLFQLQEKFFKPTTKKKVVESTFRFRDIFRDVISKHLSEFEESEEISEELEDETTTTAPEMTTIF